MFVLGRRLDRPRPAHVSFTLQFVHCPLCASPSSRKSWLGMTRFAGQDFTYRTCSRCHSMFVTPMPDDGTLSLMYAPSYLQPASAEGMVGDSRDPDSVLEILRDTTPGRFLDYGCGDGGLLERSANVGWTVQGVEFRQDVADAVALRTGFPVVAETMVDSLSPHSFDVVHLGDVLEHLTDPDRDMPRILRLVRRGGLVVAQGPLEAQPSLFLFTLRCQRLLRRRVVATTPPYHVSLATVSGQSSLFRRFGLREETLRVTEVAWPAPGQLTHRVLANPRLFLLYLIRQASRLITKLSPTRMGNRYFYVGRVVDPLSPPETSD
jgi:SAM-dependent methyltransferase